MCRAGRDRGPFPHLQIESNRGYLPLTQAARNFAVPYGFWCTTGYLCDY